MCRALVALLLLAGCDADGLVTHEQTPSLPPPVDIAPGTQVVSDWQFENRCSGPLVVVPRRESDDLNVADIPVNRLDPGDIIHMPLRCAVGEGIYVLVAIPHGGAQVGRLEGPCAPGIQPLRQLPCE